MTLASRYKQMESKKLQVMNRAEFAAKLTIPAIFPPEGHNESNPLHIPNQSLGAKAVNNITAKVMLALFPPNTAFFKLDAGIEAPEGDESAEKFVSDVTKSLVDIEETVVNHLETTTLRSTMPNGLLLLVITGNTCLDVDDEGEVRAFSLRNYVVERDYIGFPITTIIKDKTSPRKLKKEILEAHYDQKQLEEIIKNPEQEVEVYTIQEFDSETKRFKVYQELNEKTIEGSEGTYPKDSPRFMPIRWRAVDGEEYGRGLVEENFGDLSTYDGLSLDISLNSKQAAKLVKTVKPNSFITPAKLERATSGTILLGDADDVKSIREDKSADMRISFEKSNELKQSISESFLLHSSVQRDAERVTAEEIRYMAQELEDSLGGVYSTLGQEIQRPLLNRLLKILTKKNKIEPIPKDVELKIVTGLDALGRSHETNKLMMLIRSANEMLTPERVAPLLKDEMIITSLGNGLGIDATRFLKTPEEVKQAQEQQMGQDMLQNVAPGVAQELVKQQQQ